MIESLEPMLRAEGLSDTRVGERIKLIQSISYEVDSLVRNGGVFKGLGIFGSILSKRFNRASSDIDVSLSFGATTINEEMIAEIKDALERRIKLPVHPSFNWRNEVYMHMELPPSLETGWSFFVPAFFGVYMGDEAYRKRRAKGVIDILKPNGQAWWDVVRATFSELGHKDLTNAKENFSLSSFKKVCLDYERVNYSICSISPKV